MTAPDPTPRTTIRREAHRAVRDRAALDALLDASRIGHLAVVDDGQPYVLPVVIARVDDAVLVHGSTGSRLFRALAGGAPTCLTVTSLDGLVLARSAFETSMNYRSAVVLGHCSVVEGATKVAALERFTESVLPGRWAHVRHPTTKELAATLVLALPLTEWSLKVRTGGPQDESPDSELPVWAGVVPLDLVAGEPVAAVDLPSGVELPEHVRTLATR